MPISLFEGSAGFSPAQGVFLKTKLNQGFRTFDFLVMAVSLIIVGSVSVPIVEQNFEGEHIDAAKKETEKIAQQLTQSAGNAIRTAYLESYKNYKIQKNSRAIASIGSRGESSLLEPSLGKDPWGQPYHFKFLRNKLGAPVQIVVWSDGPSQRQHNIEVQLSGVSGVEEVKFDKSDVVVSKISVR